MTKRILITIEYDGGPFVGWQRQDNGDSVQAAIEEAAAAFIGTSTAVTGAGRTDSGVHATCLLYTSPSPRDLSTSRMPSSA